MKHSIVGDPFEDPFATYQAVFDKPAQKKNPRNLPFVWENVERIRFRRWEAVGFSATVKGETLQTTGSNRNTSCFLVRVVSLHLFSVDFRFT
jgi:hypothetical protein